MVVQRKNAKRRRGASIAEVLVSATLLVTTLGIVGTCAVGSKRLFQHGEHHRVAVEELSNQLELLSMLPDAELEEALADLNVSPQVAERLPGARLDSDVRQDPLGQRITLSLTWERIGNAQPISMSAWLKPAKPTERDTKQTAGSLDNQPSAPSRFRIGVSTASLMHDQRAGSICFRYAGNQILQSPGLVQNDNNPRIKFCRSTRPPSPLRTQATLSEESNE